jgi:hypothetical protein
VLRTSHREGVLAADGMAQRTTSRDGLLDASRMGAGVEKCRYPRLDGPVGMASRPALRLAAWHLSDETGSRNQGGFVALD